MAMRLWSGHAIIKLPLWHPFTNRFDFDGRILGIRWIIEIYMFVMYYFEHLLRVLRGKSHETIVPRRLRIYFEIMGAECGFSFCECLFLPTFSYLQCIDQRPPFHSHGVFVPPAGLDGHGQLQYDHVTRLPCPVNYRNVAVYTAGWPGFAINDYLWIVTPRWQS